MKVLFDRMIAKYGKEAIINYCKLSADACKIANEISVESRKLISERVQAEQEWWDDKAKEIEGNEKSE